MNSDWTPERLRALRKAYDESQRHFADRIGVSPDTVQFWEQGRGFPSGPAQKLLEILEERASIKAAI